MYRCQLIQLDIYPSQYLTLHLKNLELSTPTVLHRRQVYEDMRAAAERNRRAIMGDLVGEGPAVEATFSTPQAAPAGGRTPLDPPGDPSGYRGSETYQAAMVGVHAVDPSTYLDTDTVRHLVICTVGSALGFFKGRP